MGLMTSMHSVGFLGDTTPGSGRSFRVRPFFFLFFFAYYLLVSLKPDSKRVPQQKNSAARKPFFAPTRKLETIGCFCPWDLGGAERATRDGKTRDDQVESCNEHEIPLMLIPASEDMGGDQNVCASFRKDNKLDFN